ncbi:hypothetical protein [Peptoniphilus duerdenii]|uniref:Uncharacterized protein n=1 Tax=Peptoniphilus duerdenii ATCC BAA-1640 TaxID=862517 RepID=E0NL86_9FIRM|nr:hypothetical protein [Peptoniphilus duerdenii]EFM25461.1 hypothetical protein HMPREF9225_0925 [Peptoniphilus duerdenii ATCC BAA-1640]
MTKTQLVNVFNTDEQDTLRNIFFLIGDMMSHREELMDSFNNINSKYYGKVTFEYSGFSILLKTSEIPQVLKFIAHKGIDIYSVFEVFKPV